MKKICIEDLSVQKKDRDILKSIYLEFKSNNIYGVVGNNGAGKTTLFKTIMGLVNYRGTITIDDKIISKYNIKYELKKMGIVLPFPEEYNDRKVKEIYSEHIYYMTGDEKTDITHELEQVGVKIFSDERIKDLSKGTKQKLNISMAFSHSPELLILDEPFNGLDQDGIIMLKKKILNYKRLNTITIISSHSLSDLEDVIDNLIILEKGEIIGMSSIKNLKNNNIDIKGYFDGVRKEN